MLAVLSFPCFWPVAGGAVFGKKQCEASVCPSYGEETCGGRVDPRVWETVFLLHEIHYPLWTDVWQDPYCIHKHKYTFDLPGGVSPFERWVLVQVVSKDLFFQSKNFGGKMNHFFFLTKHVVQMGSQPTRKDAFRNHCGFERMQKTRFSGEPWRPKSWQVMAHRTFGESCFSRKNMVCN